MSSVALSLLSLLLVGLFTTGGVMGNDMAENGVGSRDYFWSYYNIWPVDELSVGSRLNKSIKWSQPKNSTNKGKLKGFVSCGGGYCPSEAPVCCGGPQQYFCIPGGMSCCSANGGAYAEACSVDGLCCASLLNATCCKSDEVCVMDRYDNSVCEKDACSTRHSADECFQESENCKWCCSDRRCVSKPTQCKIGSTVISRGEKCESRCQYADTCNLCLWYNNDKDSNEDSCAWCCSSQSCISTDAVRTCENDQVVNDLQVCSACQAHGSGLNPHFVWTTTQGFVLLAVIVLPSGVLTCFCVARGLFYLYGNSRMRNGMRVVDAEAHLLVRRYGFDATAQVPRLSRPFFALRTWTRGLFSTVFTSTKISSEEAGVPAVRGVLQCCACHSTLKLEALATAVNFMKRGKPELSDGASEQAEGGSSANDPKHEDSKDDDNVVILFPCCHQFCYPCVGLETTRSLETESCNPAPLPDETDRDRESYLRAQGAVDAGPQPALPREEQQEQGQEPKQEQEQEEQINPLIADICVPSPGQSLPMSMPQQASRTWKDKIFGSLRRLGKPRINLASENKENREKLLIEHIGKKCPECREPVRNILFPESILKL